MTKLTTSNPKEAAGKTKEPRCHVPLRVLQELHRAHNNGAIKYGHFNWRLEGVDLQTYWSALHRHLEEILIAYDAAHAAGGLDTLEGRMEFLAAVTETDPVTGIEVNSFGAAMANLSVMLDATLLGKMIDNVTPAEVLPSKPAGLDGKPSNATAIEPAVWSGEPPAAASPEPRIRPGDVTAPNVEELKKTSTIHAR